MDVTIRKGRHMLAGVPEGYDGAVLAEYAAEAGRILFVARDDRRMAAVAESIEFFSNGVECISMPAWDCLPYDRVSPRADILARRVDALTSLAERGESGARGPGAGPPWWVPGGRCSPDPASCCHRRHS